MGLRGEAARGLSVLQQVRQSPSGVAFDVAFDFAAVKVETGA